MNNISRLYEIYKEKINDLVNDDQVLNYIATLPDEVQDELLEYIDEFRDEFLRLEVAEVSFPRTVKGIDKYSHSVYS